MIDLGMHTDNWRTLRSNFRTAVESAVKYSLSHIEFGVIHGQYFVQGLRSGVLSIECSGSDRNIRRSVAFLRELLA